MWRLAILIWTILGATLSGVFMLIVLLVPSLPAAVTGRWILIAVAAGSILAVPISYAVAKAISARTTA